MKTFIFFFLLAGVLASPVFCQTPDSLWSQTFGGLSPDDCYSIQQTSDGGYMMAGAGRSAGAGWYDFWLIKTDADGDSLWGQTFGGIDEDWCYSAVQTLDDGYILAGYTKSFGAGFSDFWLVKTDTNGDSLWSRTYGGIYYDECRSIKQTSDNGYILAGYTDSYGSGWTDGWLIRTDSNGDSLWTEFLGGSQLDYCYAVQQTSDDGYIIGGATISFGVFSWDAWLAKTDADGNQLWNQTYGGDYYDECTSVLQTPDGGYLMAGVTYSIETGYDFLLIKTNANGDSLWGKTYGGTDDEWCYSIEETWEGGYVLAGYTRSFGAGVQDYWLLKINADGDSLWSRTFGGFIDDPCYSAHQCADGGYILGGHTQSFSADYYSNFWLVKTGPGKPYDVTVSLDITGTFPVLRWKSPQTCSNLIYYTTEMGDIGGPPGPGWSLAATVAGTPVDPYNDWTDPAGFVPYKRYAITMSCP